MAPAQPDLISQDVLDEVAKTLAVDSLKIHWRAIDNRRLIVARVGERECAVKLEEDDVDAITARPQVFIDKLLAVSEHARHIVMSARDLAASANNIAAHDAWRNVEDAISHVARLVMVARKSDAVKDHAYIAERAAHDDERRQEAP